MMRRATWPWNLLAPLYLLAPLCRKSYCSKQASALVAAILVKCDEQGTVRRAILCADRSDQTGSILVFLLYPINLRDCGILQMTLQQSFFIWSLFYPVYLRDCWILQMALQQSFFIWSLLSLFTL